MQKIVLAFALAFVYAGSGRAQDIKKCVAVRGNGHYVTAHFGGLARIIEDHGIMHGIAGSSSATLSAFIYDSILENSAVKNASGESQQRRVALLLKSVYGLLDALKDRGLFLLLGERDDPQHRELLNRMLTSTEDAIAAINAFEYPYGLNIINRSFVEFAFSNSGGRDFHYRQAAEAIKNLTSFRVESPIPLVRPGIFNFEALGPLASRLADFYAQTNFSDDDQAEFLEWIERCEGKTANLSWDEINRDEVFQEEPTCTRGFMNLAFSKLRRKSRIAKDLPMYERKLGVNLDVLIGTGIIEGRDAYIRFMTIKNMYLNGKVEEHLGIDYKNLKFGYWGSDKALLENVESNLIAKFENDEKSRKFLALEPVPSWKTVLKFSPAEPGLSDAMVVNSNLMQISVGGWSDLHPVQVLDAAGCDEVYYLTRMGEESKLAVDMVRLFNGGEDNLEKLYSLSDMGNKVSGDESMSSFKRALQLVNGGVLCTDWNNQKFSGRNILELGEEAYKAKMVYPNEQGNEGLKNRSWEISSAKTDVSCRAGAGF